MIESNIVHDTFVLHRTFSKTPAQVFAAFADIGKKRRWFAEGGSHDVLDYALDFRIGGAETAHYRLNDSTPFPGVTIEHQGTHLDIVPDARVVVGSTMSFGGKKISASLVTFEMLPAEGGTALICTHQAVFYEGADGPQIRRAGMEALIARLADSLGDGGA